MKNFDQNISDDEIAGELPDSVNLLRERTFNNELKSLVSRISNNETIEDGKDSNKKISKRPQEKDKKSSVIEKLHRLYYKAMFASKVLSLETDITLKSDEVSEIKEKQNLFNSINKNIKEYLMFDFTMMEYSFFDKCYLAKEDNQLEGFFLSLIDTEYSKIINSENGIFLNIDEIRDNKYLSKKFNSDFLDKQGSIFLVNFNKYIQKFIKNTQEVFGEKYGTLLFFDPIIVVYCEDTYCKSEIQTFEILSNFILPELMNIINPVNEKKLIASNNGYYSHLNMISSFRDFVDKNFIFRSFELSVSKILDVQTNYIVKYFFEKTKENLDSGITILFLSTNRYLCIVRTNESENFLKSTAEYNKVWNDIFYLK